MSVLFGTWNLDGRPVDELYLKSVQSAVSRYGPDGGNCYMKDNVAILYYALHTTKESRQEVQPHPLRFGDLICWDGRLDNRAELIRDLGPLLSPCSTDLDIVAAAYERWDTDCFCKLLGDWAAAIWSYRSRRVILAKDFVGTRQLYYCTQKARIAWSTLLPSLVLLAETRPTVNEEYIAGYLSRYPAPTLTPYAGIHSVPAGSFVTLGPRDHMIREYWVFDPCRKIHYQSDGEYEEHFHELFRRAVQRRLRSEKSVLAELSGGMDSASIVCVADELIASGQAETLRLDTISLFDDSEPNWDERPYFTRVEQRRGRVGQHIRIAPEKMFASALEIRDFEPTPACTAYRLAQNTRELSEPPQNTNLRVVLSGFGGDEVMGGVPTPIPEFQDLLVTFRLAELTHQLKVWALRKRVPWFHLLWSAIEGFAPLALRLPRKSQRTNWLNPTFLQRNKQALHGYDERTRFLGSLPSFQANVLTLNQLRRQLACNASAGEMHCEKRYPYLDRDLLEFMYAVPRSQIVRPGRRRSLMRRALAGVVPDEILERKRKAFAARSPMAAISEEWGLFSNLHEHLKSSFLGIVDDEKFWETLQRIKRGAEVPLARLMRTLFVEFWLINQIQHGIPVHPFDPAFDVVQNEHQVDFSKQNQNREEVTL